MSKPVSEQVNNYPDYPFSPYGPSPSATHLLVLVPGQRLSRQHKPVLLGATLHQADVVDGQPAPADHLGDRVWLSGGPITQPGPPSAQRPYPQQGGKPGDKGRDTSSQKTDNPTLPRPKHFLLETSTRSGE